MPNDLGKSFLALSLNAEAATEALEQMRRAMDEALFGNLATLPKGVTAQMFGPQSVKPKTMTVPLTSAQVRDTYLTMTPLDDVASEPVATTTKTTRRIDLEDA